MPYLRAAVLLQVMSKGDALKELKRLAKVDDEARVIVLCRMLFAKKAASTFREPALGAPYFMGGSKASDWPLAPLEVVDGVPFLIVWGYSLGGKAERSDQYLTYCMDNCEWSTTRFTVANKNAQQKALNKLLASLKWREPLADYERKFLWAQIND